MTETVQFVVKEMTIQQRSEVAVKLDSAAAGPVSNDEQISRTILPDWTDTNRADAGRVISGAASATALSGADQLICTSVHGPHAGAIVQPAPALLR